MRKSFNEFLDDGCDHFSLWLQELSDRELVKSLPLLVRGLNIRALQEVLSKLSTCPVKKVMNRGWLEGQILDQLSTFCIDDGGNIGEPLQQVIGIVRDRRSARKYPSAGFLSDLPLLPTAAARVALTKLEMLPLQTLRVMHEVISGKELSEVSVLKPKYVGNKERYVSGIRIHAKALLEEPVLPPILQKALLVMSLSARATVGEDGNLRFCLNTEYRGPEELQDKILLAYSRLHLLDLEELETAYLEISEQAKENVCSQHTYFDINSGSRRESQRKHPNDFKQFLSRILFDYVIRSGSLDVPGHVIQAVGTMNAAAEKKKSETSPRGSLLLKLKQQFDDEVACVADFSSQLRDLIVDGCGHSDMPQDLEKLLGGADMYYARVDPDRVAKDDAGGPDGTDIEDPDDVDSIYSEDAVDDDTEPQNWFHSLPTNATDGGSDGVQHVSEATHPRSGSGVKPSLAQSAASSAAVNAGPTDVDVAAGSDMEDTGATQRGIAGSKHASQPARQKRKRKVEPSVVQSGASSGVANAGPDDDVDTAAQSDTETSGLLFVLGDDYDIGSLQEVDSSESKPTSTVVDMTKYSDTRRERKRQQIADKAAVLMYTFIGRAMAAEAAGPESAPVEPAQKYLAGGCTSVFALLDELPGISKRCGPV